MKKRKFFTKILSIIAALTLSIVINAENCFAYQLLSDTTYRFTNPANVTFYIEHNADYYDTYAPMIKEHVPKWNINSNINARFWDSASANVHFYFSTLNNGIYGQCSALNKSRRNINLYYDWFSLDRIQKAETIVHEMGHAFGLAHTQSSNNSISVMRQYGFNNKPYPLQDDIYGISALLSQSDEEFTFPETTDSRKEINIPAKTASFNSLEELETNSPIIIKGKKSSEQEPSYEYNDLGEIITSYTLSKIEITEIFKDDSSLLTVNDSITILENEALNPTTQQIEHIANYKKMEMGNEYYLFIYKSDNSDWYIPSGVTFGKIPVNQNEEILFKESILEKNNTVYPQEEIAIDVYKKYN